MTNEQLSDLVQSLLADPLPMYGNSLKTGQGNGSSSCRSLWGLRFLRSYRPTCTDQGCVWWWRCGRKM
eukprot:jgi/Chrzof1/850/Cz01g31100.t1